MAMTNTELQHRHRRTLNGTISSKRQSAKQRATELGLEFALTTGDLHELWNKQRGLCAISGAELGYVGTGWCAASIDRIDPSKGYTLDNVQWVCWRVNDAKSNMKNEDFITMCAAIIARSKI